MTHNTKEEWEKELERLAVKIYPGELPNAIHGELYDPEKLRNFITSQRHQERGRIVEMLLKKKAEDSDEQSAKVLFEIINSLTKE